MTRKEELLFALSDIDEKYLRCIAPMLKEKPISTWRYVMKKSVKFAVTAAAAVLTVGVIAVAMFLQSGPATVGSGGSPGKGSGQKLRICIDVGSTSNLSDVDRQEAAAKSLLNSLIDYGEEQGFTAESVEMEVIPADAAERASILQRIRTEVMAGKGPDVFICMTEGMEQNLLETSRLFPYVNKAMADGLFLPLGDYIPNFQFTTWNELVPQVMDGGKDDSGRQVIVPLRFSVPCMAYDQPVPQAESFAGLSWGDVLAADDPILAQQLSWAWPIGTFLIEETQNKNIHPAGLPYLYTDLIHFQDGGPAMEKEALSSAVKECLSAYQASVENGSDVPSWAAFPGWHLSNRVFFDMNDPDFCFLPVRNDRGGATAVVSLYCAVNANTAQPEKSAFVVDYLLSKNYQEFPLTSNTPSVFDALSYFTAPSMSVNTAVDWGKRLPVSESGRESWKKVCDEINFVHYPSPIDTEIGEVQLEIETFMRDSYNPEARMDEFVKGSITDEEIDSIIDSRFAKIQQLLDEG